MGINYTVSQIQSMEFLKTLSIQVPRLSQTIQLEKIENLSESLLEIKKTPDSIIIRYSKNHLFYRGMFLLLPQLIEKGEKEVVERTSINEVGYSLDASRNGVMKVETLKKFIAYLSIMGFNTLYLYTEDTYEVKDLPYLGYLRGRYSKQEIREVTSFAKDFGMEVIPSIQTLAHLTTFLRWPQNESIKDDANTLLIGESQTYVIIEKMIVACKQMYQTNRIHLGMDEAYQAGLGRYLEKYGYKERVDLMIEHIKIVEQIAKKHEMHVLIWSDFIYKLLDQTKSEGLYSVDAQINKKNEQRLPADLTYVHGDYGGEDVKKYEQVIQNHLDFCDTDHYIFAGGAHIWNRLAPNHGKSFKTIEASIKACLNKNVKSVMLTTWGDDGQETTHWHSLLSALYYTEQIYHGDVVIEKIRLQFDQLFGKESFHMMYLLRKFDEIDTVSKNNTNMTNISKLLLWQDCLLGIYDYHVIEYNKIVDRKITDYYAELANELDIINLSETKQPLLLLIQSRYVTLAKVLSIKSEVGVRLHILLSEQDRDGLQKLQKDLVELKKQITILVEQHEQIWHHSYKTNGWEILELRYAGLQSRIQTTHNKIEAYLNGKEALTEIMEKKLPFCDYTNPVEINGFDYGKTAQIGYH